MEVQPFLLEDVLEYGNDLQREAVLPYIIEHLEDARDFLLRLGIDLLDQVAHLKAEPFLLEHASVEDIIYRSRHVVGFLLFQAVVPLNVNPFRGCSVSQVKRKQLRQFRLVDRLGYDFL